MLDIGCFASSADIGEGKIGAKLHRVLEWDECGDYLGEEEQAIMARLKHPGRRLEWLGARIALKQLVLDAGLVQSPRQCRIEKDHRGRPWIRIVNHASKRRKLNCSISHKNGIAAVCVGWLPEIEVGIDIERVSEKPWRLRHAFVNSNDLLSGRMSQWGLHTTLWACKEAASKVLGLGLAADIKSLVVAGDENNRFSVTRNELETINGIFGFYRDWVIALGWCFERRAAQCDCCW